MVGKLMPDFFPHIFGPGQEQPLEAAAVTAAFKDLASEVNRDLGGGRSAEDIADGFIRIAVENMANAIKKISVQRGYDVARYAVTCFGGAGGQHACLVADALGIPTVLIHPFSSLMSAYGMGLADIRAPRQQAIEQPLAGAALASIKAVGERLGAEARAEVCGQGVPDADVIVHVRAHIRYAGTDTALEVPAFALPLLEARAEGLGVSAPSPRLPSGRLRPSEPAIGPAEGGTRWTGYGEGHGEGAFPQARTRGHPPSPLLSPQAGRGTTHADPRSP